MHMAIMASRTHIFVVGVGQIVTANHNYSRGVLVQFDVVPRREYARL